MHANLQLFKLFQNKEIIVLPGCQLPSKTTSYWLLLGGYYHRTQQQFPNYTFKPRVVLWDQDKLIILIVTQVSILHRKKDWCSGERSQVSTLSKTDKSLSANSLSLLLRMQGKGSIPFISLCDFLLLAKTFILRPTSGTSLVNTKSKKQTWCDNDNAPHHYHHQHTVPISQSSPGWNGTGSWTFDKQYRQGEGDTDETRLIIIDNWCS